MFRLETRITKADATCLAIAFGIAAVWSQSIKAAEPRSREVTLTKIHCTGTDVSSEYQVSSPMNFVVIFNAKKVVQIEGLDDDFQRLINNGEAHNSLVNNVSEFAVTVSGHAERPKSTTQETLVDYYSLTIDRADSSFQYRWSTTINGRSTGFDKGSGTCQPFKPSF